MKRVGFPVWGIPLFLIVCCPPTIIFLWMIAAQSDGSVLGFLQTVTWKDLAAHFPVPSFAAARILLSWALLQLVLLVVLPGKEHLGPVTPMGNRPHYKLNGVAAFLVTHFLIGLAVSLALFSPTIVYDHFGEILSLLSIFAFIFCAA